MIKRVLLAAALLSLLPAAGADTRPALVEIANFDCPFCREMSSHHERIERAAKRAGLRFVYAPIPNDGQAHTAWRERLYYAARNLPISEGLTRRALLDAQEANHAIHTPEALIAWMDLKVHEVDWARFVSDHVRSASSIAPVERSLRLAARAKVDSYPSFLLVSNQGIELIPLKGEVSEQAEALIKTLENYKQ